MGANPPPVPAWRQFLAQYLVPTAIASIVATLLSVFAALNAQRKDERTFNTTFQGLVTSAAVMDAFKGSDMEEQKAASQLLALHAVADTTPQRRTVLLLAARLLNANTGSEATGGPAARLLNILIAQDVRDDKNVRGLIESQQFVDLVTAGYANDYYNDDLKRDSYLWSTLNGDQPITHDAKLAVLTQLTASNLDGWVHVATFASDYRFPNQTHTTAAPSPTPAPAVQAEKPQAAIGAGTAQSFLAALNEVNRDRSLRRATNLLAQYAIAPASPPAPPPDAAPAASPSTSPSALPTMPLLRAADPIDGEKIPAKLVMLKPRLLRNRAPLEFVNPDGSFHKGSLGTVIGAVPAGTCIEVVEPLHPVLVFVTAPISLHVAGAKSDEWTGLIHMWAHVRRSEGCGFEPVVPHRE
ncbi:MAG: hypothetical protein NVS3B7_07910 [Candidatus Elarobacter sp.]